jgi:hypothetical protein
LDDLLKRKIISEEEFDRANRIERKKVAEMEARQTEIKVWLEKERDRTALAERLPISIGSFLAAFQSMDIRQQKAQLQTIVKAAKVYNDGRIELEFREY